MEQRRRNRSGVECVHLEKAPLNGLLDRHRKLIATRGCLEKPGPAAFLDIRAWYTTHAVGQAGEELSRSVDQRPNLVNLRSHQVKGRAAGHDLPTPE